MKITQPKAAKSQDRNDSLIYQFALCGGRSSGKTCILAAMAMAPPNLHGHTVSMPHLPNGAPDDLRHGHTWVGDCVKIIESGSVPEPNAIAELPTHARLRYQLTDKSGRESFMDIFDYSGELIEGHASQSDLAEKLREALSNMDGLLVVAEYPRPNKAGDGKPDNENWARLHDLGSAFALYRQEERRRHGANSICKPIAVLVNKWDRAGTLTSPVNPTDQLALLEQFIESSPQHRQLCDRLKPAAEGHFRCFAVSALGPGQCEQDQYRPAQVRPYLLSHGLEDPFIWLMERKDALDLGALEGRVRDKKQWWNPLYIWETWRASVVLCRRVMPKTEEGRKLFWLRARAAFASLRWWVMLGVAVTPCLLTVQKVRACMDDAEWVSVEHESDQTKQDAAAKDYLRHWPGGRHLVEAQQLIRDNAIDVQRAGLQDWLVRRNGRIQSLSQKVKGRPSDSDLKQFNKDANALANDSPPNWIVATPDQRGEYLRQQKSLAATQREIAVGINVQGARAKYRDLMENRQLKEAADLLIGLDHASYADLFDDFRAHILAALDAKWRELDSDGAKWKSAEEQTVTVFSQPTYAPLMGKDAMDALSALRDRIRSLGDRYLYEQCRNRNRDTLQAYLEGAPVGGMKEDVQSYLRFLDARAKPAPMTLRISSIEWSGAGTNWFGRRDTTVKLFVFDKTGKQIATKGKWSSGFNGNRVGKWTNDLPSVAISDQSPSDRLDVSVQLWASGWSWSWMNIGNWKDAATMEDIANTTKTAPGVGQGFDNPTRISFSVSGLPGEPRLPEWHDSK